MPSGLAAQYREAVAEADRSQLVLEKNVWSSTGFTGVTKVKGKYQARVQVPGDGRGGSKKRRQHSLPGLFATAEDAAVSLALFKQNMLRDAEGRLRTPPKQNQRRKERSRQPKKPEPAPVPLLQPPMSMPTAMAVCVPFLVQHAPIVAATPLPMQPFPSM